MLNGPDYIIIIIISYCCNHHCRVIRAFCVVGLWAEFAWYSSLNNAVTSAGSANSAIQGIETSVSQARVKHTAPIGL